MAIRTNNIDIIQLILDAGAQIINNAVYNWNERDYNGDSLFKAINTNNKLIIDLILLAGGNPLNLEESHPKRSELLIRKQYLLLTLNITNNCNPLSYLYIIF